MFFTSISVQKIELNQPNRSRFKYQYDTKNRKGKKTKLTSLFKIRKAFDVPINNKFSNF